MGGGDTGDATERRWVRRGVSKDDTPLWATCSPALLSHPPLPYPARSSEFGAFASSIPQSTLSIYVCFCGIELLNHIPGHLFIRVSSPRHLSPVAVAPECQRRESRVSAP
jgi:hypothetical protein